MDTDTPETDALILREVCEADIIAHAMKLERERNEARRLAETYRKMAYDCKWPKPVLPWEKPILLKTE